MKSAYRHCGDWESCKLRRYFLCTDSKLYSDELGIVLCQAVYVAESFAGRAVTFFFQCRCCKLKKMPFQRRASATCLLESADLNNTHFEMYKYFLLFLLVLSSTFITRNIEDNTKKILQVEKKSLNFSFHCACAVEIIVFFLNFLGHSNKKKLVHTAVITVPTY